MIIAARYKNIVQGMRETDDLLVVSVRGGIKVVLKGRSVLRFCRV